MTSQAATGRCDPGLIEAARGGDEKALLSLIAVAQPDIRRYAARNCRAADIDDAVQETLLLLYRRVGTLRALRDIEELSIDEIAAVLGLTRESVKARIHRARMLIREYLIRD